MSPPTDSNYDQLDETESKRKQPTIDQPPEQDLKTQDSDSDLEFGAIGCGSYEDNKLEEKAITVDSCDEGVFSDIVSTIRSLKIKIEEYKKAQQQAKDEQVKLSKNKTRFTSKTNNISTSKKEDLDKTAAKGFLIDWYHTLVQLLHVLEEYKNDITNQNYLAVKKETHALSETLHDISTPLDDHNFAYAYEIFYLYFNFFTLQLVKNYSTLHTDMNEVVKMLYEKCVLKNIISTLRKVCSVLFASSFTTNDMQQLIDCNDILLSMMNYVNEYHLSSIFPKRSKTSELFLDFIGNYCSKIELVPNLIKLGVPESVVRCITIALKSDRDRFNKKVKSVQYNLYAVKRLIVIIYKICRHENGIHVINSLDMGPVLEKIQIRNEKHRCGSYKLAEFLYMTRALLSTPDQIRITRKQMNTILDGMLNAVDFAAADEKYQSCKFHVSEPLVVLVKLMVHDRTLYYLIQHPKLRYMQEATILKFLVNLFLRYHTEVKDDNSLKLITCTALCNIFWHVSLRPQYKQELQKSEKFKTLIQQIAHEHNDKKTTSNYQYYVPTYMDTIQKAANGILCNIFDRQWRYQSDRNDVDWLTESIESALVDDTYQKPASDAHEDLTITNDSKLDDIVSSDSATTSDSYTTSSDDDESHVSVTFYSGIFSDIVTELRTLEKQATAPDRLVKLTLIEFQRIQVELVNLIESTKITEIMNKNYLAVEKVVKHSMKPLLNWDQVRTFGENNPNDNKEILHMYFNFFKLNGIQNYLLNTGMNNALAAFYQNRLVDILSAMISMMSASFFTKQDLRKLSNYNDILSLMLNYVKVELESITVTPKLSKTTSEILGFLWTYSDKTVLIPNLIKIGYSEALLEWLSIIYGYGERRSHIKRTKEQKETAVYPIINIIQNISRHDDGIQNLISCNALNLIKQFEDDIDPYEKMMVLTRLILALISKPEQIQNDRKRMNAVVDCMLQIIVDGSKSKYFRTEDFHISEPLIALVKLICYDRTLDYILQHADVDFNQETKEKQDDQKPEQSIVEFFINLFIKYHSTVKEDDPLKITTCTALCNILWSVSLRTQYKQELQDNNEFKKLIDRIAHDTTNTTSAHYVPKYIENIQEAAEGILCNISDTPTETQRSLKRPVTSIRELVLFMGSSSRNSSTSPNSRKPSVMISYSHGDNDVCTQVYNALLKRHDDFDIWIDRKYCKTGYLWGKIADGIQEAGVILCLLSEKYYESKSCQQEFVYAHDHLKKQVLPVFLQQDKPPGWLGEYMFASLESIQQLYHAVCLAIHTCILKYIRFKQTQPLEQEKLMEMMEVIDEYLRLNNKKRAEDTQKVVIPTTASANYKLALSALPTITTSVENEAVIQSKPEESNTRKPPVNLDEKPVSEWEKEYVFQWFQENEILSELYKLHPFKDGSELLNYASQIMTDEKADAHYNNYFQACMQMYNGKILLLPQFLRFVDALRKLYTENESKSRMEAIQRLKEATANNKPPTRNRSRIPRRCSISKMQQ